jgi:hypothetical protein
MSHIDDRERPLMLLGAVLCHRLAGPPRGGASGSLEWAKALAGLSDWIVAENDRLRNGPSVRFLFGLTTFRSRDALWRALAQHLLVNPPEPHPELAESRLRTLGAALVNNVGLWEQP